MIAYLTHDDVNAEFAMQLAAQLGSDLTVLSMKDVNQFVTTEVLLIDLDHLPPECRSNLFRLVRTGGTHEGLSVHSYHLSRAELRTLRSAGVVVARRLTLALLTSCAERSRRDDSEEEKIVAS